MPVVVTRNRSLCRKNFWSPKWLKWHPEFLNCLDSGWQSGFKMTLCSRHLGLPVQFQPVMHDVLGFGPWALLFLKTRFPSLVPALALNDYTLPRTTPSPCSQTPTWTWSQCCYTIRYDTIRDAILTCARKPTWVGLIYRTETTTENCKTEKLKSKNRYVRSNSKSQGDHVVSSEEEERLQWEGFAEKEGFMSLEWNRE